MNKNLKILQTGFKVISAQRAKSSNSNFIGLSALALLMATGIASKKAALAEEPQELKQETSENGGNGENGEMENSEYTPITGEEVPSVLRSLDNKIIFLRHGVEK